MENQLPKPTLWQQVVSVIRSPYQTLTHITKQSPLLALLAVVFVVQPIIGTGIDLIKEYHSVRIELDPTKRPVTKEELDLVNAKINFIQTLVINDLKAKADGRAAFVAEHPETPTAVVNPPGITDAASVDANVARPLNVIQGALTTAQKEADTAYVKKEATKK